MEQPQLEILEGDGGDIDKSFQVRVVAIIAVAGVVVIIFHDIAYILSLCWKIMLPEL